MRAGTRASYRSPEGRLRWRFPRSSGRRSRRWPRRWPTPEPRSGGASRFLRQMRSHFKWLLHVQINKARRGYRSFLISGLFSNFLPKICSGRIVYPPCDLACQAASRRSRFAAMRHSTDDLCRMYTMCSRDHGQQFRSEPIFAAPTGRFLPAIRGPDQLIGRRYRGQHAPRVIASWSHGTVRIYECPADSDQRAQPVQWRIAGGVRRRAQHRITLAVRVLGRNGLARSLAGGSTADGMIRRDDQKRWRAPDGRKPESLYRATPVPYTTAIQGRSVSRENPSADAHDHAG